MKLSKKLLSVLLAVVMVGSLLAIVPVSVDAAAQMAKPALTVSNKSNGIRAEWNKISGAVKYRVYYKSEKDGKWTSKDTSNNYYPLLGTVIGRKYAFQVQPINNQNAFGPYSAVKNIVYYPPAYTTKPNVKVSCKTNGIRVEWNKFSGATSYIVYYRKAGTKSWSSISTKNNYYPFLNTVIGTAYNYQVQPVFGKYKGAYSSVKTITRVRVSNQKPTLTVSNKTNGIRAEWNAIPYATSYRVFYRFDYDYGYDFEFGFDDDDEWEYVDTKKTYHPFLDAYFGAPYAFQVVPMFGESTGVYSAVKHLTFMPLTTSSIATPVLSEIVPEVSGLDVYWDPVPNAIGYGYSYYETRFKQTLYYPEYDEEPMLENCSYADTFTEGEPYQVRVRAIISEKGVEKYGPWSDPVTITNSDDYDFELREKPGFISAGFAIYSDSDSFAKLKIAVSDKDYELTKRQVKTFMRHYPYVFENIEVVKSGEYDSAVNALNDPENAPDLYIAPSDTLNRLQAADVLSPINAKIQSYIQDENDLTTAHGNYFTGYPVFPYSIDNGYVLTYDKSVVSDQEAQTLEATLAACKKSGKTFEMDVENGFYSCLFAFTGGAVTDGYESDDETQHFVDYDEDEAVQTLKAFAALMRDYKGTFVSNDMSTLSDHFADKTAGAGVAGPWIFTDVKNALGDNYGVSKLPTINVNGVNKPIVGMMGGKCICINKSTDHPKAAQMLAYYLSSEVCQRQRMEQLGYAPTNKKVIYDATDPSIKALINQKAASVPQINISPTFWYPMGALGKTLYDNNWSSADNNTPKTLLQKTVTDIKDE